MPENHMPSRGNLFAWSCPSLKVSTRRLEVGTIAVGASKACAASFNLRFKDLSSTRVPCCGCGPSIVFS